MSNTTISTVVAQNGTEFAQIDLTVRPNEIIGKVELSGTDKCASFAATEDMLCYIDSEGNRVGFDSKIPFTSALPKVKVTWKGDTNFVTNRLSRLARWFVRKMEKPLTKLALYVLRNTDVTVEYPTNTANMTVHVPSQNYHLESMSCHENVKFTLHGDKAAQYLTDETGLADIVTVSGTIHRSHVEAKMVDPNLGSIDATYHLENLSCDSEGYIHAEAIKAEVYSDKLNFVVDAESHGERPVHLAQRLYEEAVAFATADSHLQED